MHIVFLSLGSNLGDRLNNFLMAEELIHKQIGNITKSSAIYETEPWGYTNQPVFLNKVIQVVTRLSPQELLKQVLDIEIQLGRVRSDKWHQRIIDIDILFFDDLILNEFGLEIPHPHIHERQFVLIPLTEISNSLMHPAFNKTIATLHAECDDVLIVKKYA